MKNVYLVSGFKSSGKDTLCDIISSMYNPHELFRIAYADKIKRICSILFDVPLEILEGKTPENRRLREEIVPFWSDYIPDLTGRIALTRVGTDLFRQHLLDEIWSLSTINAIIRSNKQVTIVSDLRDPHTEEKLAREILPQHGFNVHSIRLERDDKPSWYDHALKAYFDADIESIKFLNENNIHISEWIQVGLTPDHIIRNDTSTDATQALSNLTESFTSIIQNKS